MRNREAILKKIDQIDSSLNKSLTQLRRGDDQGFIETINNMREQIDQLRTYVDSEPISGYELNSSVQ